MSKPRLLFLEIGIKEFDDKEVGRVLRCNTIHLMTEYNNISVTCVHCRTLTFSLEDVEAFHHSIEEFLEKNPSIGERYERPAKLSDAEKGTLVWKLTNPTRNDILNAMSDIYDVATPGSGVVVFISTHGFCWRMSEKIDRPVLYELGIVCKDSHRSLAHPDLYLYVVYRWLAKLFTEKEKSLSFAFILLETCHSGLAVEQATRGREVVSLFPEGFKWDELQGVDDPVALERHKQWFNGHDAKYRPLRPITEEDLVTNNAVTETPSWMANMAILSACHPDESAWEYDDGSLSRFIFAFKEVLTGLAAGETISFRDLANRVTRRKFMVNSQGATHYQRPISRIGSNLAYASFLNPAQKTYAAPNAAIIVDADNNNLYAQAGKLSGWDKSSLLDHVLIRDNNRLPWDHSFGLEFPEAKGKPMCFQLQTSIRLETGDIKKIQKEAEKGNAFAFAVSSVPLLLHWKGPRANTSTREDAVGKEIALESIVRLYSARYLSPFVTIAEESTNPPSAIILTVYELEEHLLLVSDDGYLYGNAIAIGEDAKEVAKSIYFAYWFIWKERAIAATIQMCKSDSNVNALSLRGLMKLTVLDGGNCEDYELREGRVVKLTPSTEIILKIVPAYEKFHIQRIRFDSNLGIETPDLLRRFRCSGAGEHALALPDPPAAAETEVMKEALRCFDKRFAGDPFNDGVVVAARPIPKPLPTRAYIVAIYMPPGAQGGAYNYDLSYAQSGVSKEPVQKEEKRVGRGKTDNKNDFKFYVISLEF